MTGGAPPSQAPVTALRAAAYTIPTDAPEADGTFAWTSTTLVVVEVEAAGRTGIGYSYTAAAAVPLIQDLLAEAVLGHEAFDIPGIHAALQRRVRNIGRSGLAATAISAIDTALWDLRAVLLGLPLCSLLGRVREAVPVYGSGGFTTYSDDRLREQLAGWVERDGCRWVKMKVGTDPDRAPERIAAAKSAIGDRTLFIDANGAFGARQALHLLASCEEARIGWFEEPVTSDDLPGLRLVRESAPPPTEIAAGEYIFTPDDARAMLAAGAVDVLQADVTRCGGLTGFLAVAALCEAHHTDLSGHCAPAIHRHVACAAPRLRHLEWFHDHVRIEAMLFDGAPVVANGEIRPDLGRPGHGLAFKRQDAERFKVAGGLA